MSEPTTATTPATATTAPASASGAPLLVEWVDDDSGLTVCRRRRGDWSPDNDWRPFVRPEVVRAHRQPFVPAAVLPGLAPATFANPDGHGLGRRLLLVDNEARYRQRLARYFGEQRGWEVTAVGTGTEGVALYEHLGPGHFAAVVSDISMEYELAGLWLCYQVRRRGHRGLMILASTGFDNWFAVLACHVLLNFSGLDWMMGKEALNRGRPRLIRRRGLFT